MDDTGPLSDVPMNALSGRESPDSETWIVGERRVLELIATGAPLETILDAVCRVIDQQSGLRSSIFLLDAAAERLILAAGPHLPNVWQEAVASFPVTMTACGAAVTRREQTVSRDLAADPLYVGFYEAAAMADIRAAWSTPVFSKHGRALGTFAVYSNMPGSPSARDLALVNRATHLVSVAVERHRTEESLRESEVRFSRAFYANPACMTISRFADGRFVSVNDAFTRMVGYSRSEVIGQTALGLGLYPNPAHQVRMMRVLRERQARDIDVHVRTKSGDIRDVVVSMQRIEVRGDESVLTIATDITDRKRAEAALRDSEERFRQIAEHMREVFWMSAVDFSRMLYVSPGYEAIWGRTCASAYQDPHSWIEAIHPDDRLRVTAALKMERNHGFEVEYRVVRPDGSIRWVRTRGFALDDSTGQPYRVGGIAEDVTERKQAEDALRRSEQLLRLVLEAIPVGVGVLDLDGSIILNNPASTRIWGKVIASGPERYDRSEAWWHDTGKKIAPEEWASRRALTKGETAINEVIEIRAFDGARKVIQNSAVPIRDEHHALVGAVFINEDVSAQKTAERDLEASVKQMQTLATRLMHAQDDERRRIAQMLHETTAQDLAALKMLLARLNRTSDRLSDADRALLAESVQLADRSMTEARTLAYLLYPPFLDEAGLLSALRWYARGFADRSGILVDVALPDTLQRLPQDIETTLFRVVQEALINIHRHTTSPTARMGLQIAAGQLTLDIEDDGRGMAPDVVAQLLAGVGALGVGLAGMRERLNQIGGRLEIESSDRGTVVRAIVPVHAFSS